MGLITQRQVPQNNAFHCITAQYDRLDVGADRGRRLARPNLEAQPQLEPWPPAGIAALRGDEGGRNHDVGGRSHAGATLGAPRAPMRGR